MRRALPLLVALLVLAHVRWSVLPAVGTIRNDFPNYYAPARALHEGRTLDRIYERDAFHAEMRRAGLAGLGSFVPQTPLNALLLWPLAGLSPATAKGVWTVLLALAYVGAFLALRGLVPGASWVLALAFVVPSTSLANAFLFGQPYPLLLLCFVLSLRALSRGQGFLSGLLLAPSLVLKLYGLPFLAYFLWTRRIRAAFGLLAGSAVLVTLSVAVLGRPVHETYLREILPASLTGEIQDPYSPIRGSFLSLSRSLFVREPDLNPAPVADAPFVAGALGRGLQTVVLLLGVVAGVRSSGGPGLLREWAILSLSSLLASPLTVSYHFVLLVLPVAILAGSAGGARRALLWLGALAFVASPAPHFFMRFAGGWATLLAHPRLLVLASVFAWAAAPLLTRGRLLFAAACGFAWSLTGIAHVAESPWRRITEARGFILGEPVACEGGLAWVAVDVQGLVVRAPDGRVLRRSDDAADPRCVAGRLVVRSSPEAVDTLDRDATGDGTVEVRADPTKGRLFELAAGDERVLAQGRMRHPRLSPDGRWVVFQSWEDGTWDLRALERVTGRSLRLTRDPSNEVEPSWAPDGAAVLFASDRRRGLEFTALYEIPFRP